MARRLASLRESVHWRLFELSEWARMRYRTDCVFIHINRTGGTSVERALGLPFRHMTAEEARRVVGRRRWRERLTFSFVRNPWDKVASHYNYRVQTNQTGMGDEHITFEDWVRLAYGERDPRYFDEPRMFMPQIDWITDRAGNVIIDFIGQFERLNEDFTEVCARLGRRVELPHLNRSANGDYRWLYSPVTVDVVARCFRGDIDAFGFAFE